MVCCWLRGDVCCRVGPAVESFCELIVKWRDIEPHVKVKGAFLAWVIWGEHNSLVFNNKSTPHNCLLAQVARLAEEHGEYLAKIYKPCVATVSSSPRHWTTPHAGLVKLNVDASLPVDGWVGLGVVARHSNGDVLLICCCPTCLCLLDTKNCRG